MMIFVLQETGQDTGPELRYASQSFVSGSDEVLDPCRSRSTGLAEGCLAGYLGGYPLLWVVLEHVDQELFGILTNALRQYL
jgi:hypothetical protein